MKVQDLDDKIEKLMKRRSEALIELDDQKFYATPSELEMIDQEIERLTAKFEEELMDMRKLQLAGWTEMGSEEKLAGI